MRVRVSAIIFLSHCIYQFCRWIHSQSLIHTCSHVHSHLIMHHTPHTSLPLHNIGQVDNVQNILEVLVGDATPLHFFPGVRIDDLISQTTKRHVRPGGEGRSEEGCGCVGGRRKGERG